MVGKATKQRCCPGPGPLGLRPHHWSWPLLAWMRPGGAGGHRLRKPPPDVSRRLATEAGFAEAALFFNESEKKLFSICPVCVMVRRGEASPQGGKGLEHREAGRWAGARSWSWTGTEAAGPRTERGQWRARLGSCWTAAIEQKRLPQ